MTRRLPWWETLLQDVRVAMRSLRRNAGFAAATIVTLALGIGANVAIFSVVYAVLLKPLPYEAPDQIYSVEVIIPERHDQVPTLPPRVQDFLNWRRVQTTFSGVAALTGAEWNVTGSGDPQRVGGAKVSTNFFAFLGVPMAYGRGFLPEEEQPGRDKVVVISDALWRSRYGADPTLLNRTIQLNGESHLVVGIAPPSLLVPTGTMLHPSLTFPARIDVWKPVAPTPKDLASENWNHGVLVRLPAGATLERGRLQLQAALNDAVRAAVPDFKGELQTQLVPIREIYAGKVRLRLLLVFGAASLLLIAACTNVANLFLGRVASRAQEFAVRVALGARPSRIVAQVVTESVCLALLGGLLGIALAYAGVGVLLTQGPPDVQALTTGRPNLAVLAVSLLVSLASGIICGLLPAWQAFRRDPRSVLQETAQGATGGERAARVRQALVGVEIALSTALLASAALLLHSFVNLVQADRGYVIEHVVAFDLAPAGSRYSDPPQRKAFYQDLMTEIRALPGIVAVGAVSSLPALGESGTQVVFLATDTASPQLILQRPVAGLRNVTPGYFTASGATLRAGRFFTEQDSSPVAVISDALGERLWHGEAPADLIGRRIRQGDVTAPDVTIVGVVEDVRPGAMDRELAPQLYRPHHQGSTPRMTVLVRTTQDAAAISSSLRDAVHRRDPNVPISAIRTMRDIVSTTLTQRRFQMLLTSLFGMVALLLGGVGVYGVVSYSVVRRTRDIGLRLALGATRGDVIGWIFSRGMRPVVIGLLAGLLVAMALAQALRSLLFGVGPLDPLALGTVVLVLLMTAALACYLPARRAARLDPLIALRQE